MVTARDFCPDPVIVSAVERALLARNGRERGDEIMATCIEPAHHRNGDQNPSLHYNRKKFAWNCRVCGAKGGILDLAQLLGLETLSRTSARSDRRVVNEQAFQVWRADGRDVGVVHRRVDYGGGKKKMWWERNGKAGLRGLRTADLELFGVRELSPTDTTVIMVEGEAAVRALRAAGFAAVGTVTGASGTPCYRALEAIRGRDVILWPDHLDGTVHMSRIARQVRGHGIGRPRWFEWPEAREKGNDAADYFKRGGTAEHLRALLAAAPEWMAEQPTVPGTNGAKTNAVKAQKKRRDRSESQDQRDRTDPETEDPAVREQRAAQALATSRDFLDDPDLLGRIEAYIHASGFAGDATPSLLVYIALTSRLLTRPMNLALIAASASGKNYAIDTVLPMFPEEAYIAMGASSPRALVYGNHSYEHRVVIVGEADSLPEEGPAASAIRDLAETNRMAYDTVERDPDTNRWTVRHIEKPGPTGLITTSTRSLREQLSTRMLEVSISDSAEQTRAVLGAYVRTVNGATIRPDPAPFVAAQRWLQLAATRDVRIPFLDVVAAKVPADLVRMRRDFRQLVTTIQTCAFLYQRQRDRDAGGRIVATLQDYAAARAILLDTFTVAATGGVTRRIREVVQAAHDLLASGDETTTTAAIARRLQPLVHPKVAQRRVRAAVALGYLVNEEQRRPPHPARLRLGEPLPEERPALPTMEEVEQSFLHPPANEVPSFHEKQTSVFAGQRMEPEPQFHPGPIVPSEPEWNRMEPDGTLGVVPSASPKALGEAAHGTMEPLFPGGRGGNEALPPDIEGWFDATIRYAATTGMDAGETWRIGVVDVLDRVARSQAAPTAVRAGRPTPLGPADARAPQLVLRGVHARLPLEQGRGDRTGPTPIDCYCRPLPLHEAKSLGFAPERTRPARGSSAALFQPNSRGRDA